MKRAAGLLFALLAVAACAGPGSPPPPATVQDVELHASDVPRGMVLCGASGDIDSFLKRAPSNSDLATEIVQNWQAVKSLGVRKGVVNVYTPSKADCSNLFTSTTTASTPSVLAMTIEFKSAAAAAGAYNQLNLGASLAAAGATQGTATGLGRSSIVVEDSATGSSIYLAAWQKARFLNFILALGIGLPASEKAAKNVNGRIH